jgi:undecaprenyl-diphosphatase
VLARWDRAVVEAFQHAHWGPADWLFELLSNWWVKSVVIIGVGVAADLWSRRRPLGGVLATAAYFGAGGLDVLLKDAFARPRPPLVDPAVHPLVAVPHSYSMPSGHAGTAFAAAVAVALFHRRLRLPLLALAGLVAISRVWLGVHYLSDVLVGAALGTLVALALWVGVRAVARTRFWSEPASRADGAGSRPRARLASSWRDRPVRRETR